MTASGADLTGEATATRVAANAHGSLRPNLANNDAPDVPPGLNPLLAALEDSSGNYANYAGAWIDDSNNFTIHIGLTNDIADTEQAILASIDPSLISAGPPISFDQQTYSLSSLNSIEDHITSALQQSSDAYDSQLVQYLVRAGVVVSDDAVDLVLLTGTPPNVIDQLESNYGPDGGLNVSEQAQRVQPSGVRNKLSGRLLGGEWESSSDEDFNYSCSVGFSDAKSDVSDHFYTIVAGHCDDGDGLQHYQGVTGLGATQEIGTAHNNTYAPKTSSYCDCVDIGPLPLESLYSHAYFRATTATRAFTESAPDPDYTEGEPICYSGAESYEHYGFNPCGEMIGIADQEYNTEFILLNGGDCDIKILLQGDSGAPMYDGGSSAGYHFMGILGAGLNDPENGDVVFSLPANVEFAMNVTLTY
jgi:hypothetical protein